VGWGKVKNDLVRAQMEIICAITELINSAQDKWAELEPEVKERITKLSKNDPLKGCCDISDEDIEDLF
jgi:hypothetical protein